MHCTALHKHCAQRIKQQHAVLKVLPWGREAKQGHDVEGPDMEECSKMAAQTRASPEEEARHNEGT
jgi:hypothetical protein